MRLNGKVAIITGAGQGIGRAIAKRFAAEGASLAVISRSNNIYETAAGIKTPVLTIKGDVSNQDHISSLINQTVDRFGGIDILVNNAAVLGPIGPLVENKPSQWLKTLQINLFGIFLTCRAVIPIMKKRGSGKIINLSGGGSTSPRPNFTAYGASKTAVVRLTETLAEETRDLNIQVNAIAPGAVNTNMLDKVLESGSSAGAVARQEARNQLANGGTPISIPVSLAVFLASSDSNDISGKLISAVWDDWKHLKKSNDLSNKDIFTLRRVS